MARLSLSARAYDRILRVARTIADLEGIGADVGPARRRSSAVSWDPNFLVLLCSPRPCGRVPRLFIANWRPRRPDRPLSERIPRLTFRRYSFVVYRLQVRHGATFHPGAGARSRGAAAILSSPNPRRSWRSLGGPDGPCRIWRATAIALRMENDSYRDATGQLASQIAAPSGRRRRHRRQGGVDPAASRAMAHLGSREITSDGRRDGSVALMLGSAIGSPDTAFGVLSDLLIGIEDRPALVRSGVERRRALALATPSIWPVTGWLVPCLRQPARSVHAVEAIFIPGWTSPRRRENRFCAPADGVVSSASFSGNYGNLIVLDHGFGIITSIRSPLPLCRHERPAGAARRRHWIRWNDRPIDEPAPPLRNPDERSADESTPPAGAALSVTLFSLGRDRRGHPVLRFARGLQRRQPTFRAALIKAPALRRKSVL